MNHNQAAEPVNIQEAHKMHLVSLTYIRGTKQEWQVHSIQLSVQGFLLQFFILNVFFFLYIYLQLESMSSGPLFFSFLWTSGFG